MSLLDSVLDYVDPQLYFLGQSNSIEIDGLLPDAVTVTPIHPDDITERRFDTPDGIMAWRTGYRDENTGGRVNFSFSPRLLPLPFLKGEFRGIIHAEKVSNPERYQSNYEMGMIYGRSSYPLAGESYTYVKLNKQEEFSLGYGLFWRQFILRGGEKPAGFLAVDFGLAYYPNISFYVEHGWDRWGEEEVYENFDGNGYKYEPFINLVVGFTNIFQIGLNFSYENGGVDFGENVGSLDFSGTSFGLFLGTGMIVEGPSNN